MKIKIKVGDYKTVMDVEGIVELSEVYNGVGIETDQGHFGIAMRDNGIEVLLNGELVFNSNELKKEKE